MKAKTGEAISKTFDLASAVEDGDAFVRERSVAGAGQEFHDCVCIENGKTH
jgi:hypothetical protein